MSKQAYFVKERPKMRPTHRGKIVREDVLSALNLSVSEAARLLRVSRQTLHRLLAGTIGVSPEVAVRYRPPGLIGDLPELHDQAARPANSYDPKSPRPSRSQGSGAHVPQFLSPYKSGKRRLRTIRRFGGSADYPMADVTIRELTVCRFRQSI